MGSIVWDRDIAAVYDTVYASGFTASALDPMVEALAELSQGGPALEFAVGTGRVALALSARGVQTHGVELSPHMTERLRSKPGAAAVPETIGDMTAVRLSKAFPLVYLVANTIMNVTTQEDQERVFRNAALHLEPGGRFVVEVVVPQPRSPADVERARVFTLGPVPLRLASELDLMAKLAGLRLQHRWADWHRAPFQSGSTGHVSVYQKPHPAPSSRE